MSEPTTEDLLEAVKESLRKDGRLGKFKAELRSAVMSILNRHPKTDDHPTIPEETGLINELIKEYLTWNGYRYSEEILAAESGQSSERQTRENLANRLGVVDDAATVKVPLLYYIVSAFQNEDKLN